MKNVLYTVFKAMPMLLKLEYISYIHMKNDFQLCVSNWFLLMNSLVSCQCIDSNVLPIPSCQWNHWEPYITMTCCQYFLSNDILPTIWSRANKTIGKVTLSTSHCDIWLPVISLARNQSFFYSVYEKLIPFPNWKD